MNNTNSGFFGMASQFLKGVDSLGGTVGNVYGKILSAKTASNNARAAATVAKINAQARVDAAGSEAARIARARQAQAQAAGQSFTKSNIVSQNPTKFLIIAGLLGALLIIRRKAA